MRYILTLVILIFSLNSNSKTVRIDLTNSEARKFGLKIAQHKETDSEHAFSIQVPFKDKDSCTIVHLETYVYDFDGFLFHSYLANWQKKAKAYTGYIRAKKSSDLETKIVARFSCEGDDNTIAYNFGNLDELVGYYRKNNLFLAKYVPLLPLETNGTDNVNDVDPNFISLTKEWTAYKSRIDQLNYSSTKIYEDNEIREEIYYLEDEIILVNIFEKKETKPTILLQKQYFKDGEIYIMFANLDKQGELDVIQYFLDGSVKYIELLELAGIQEKHSWQKL